MNRKDAKDARKTFQREVSKEIEGIKDILNVQKTSMPLRLNLSAVFFTALGVLRVFAVN